MTLRERLEKRFGPQNPGDSKFKAKARLLQSIHRVSIGEAMGVGPKEYALTKGHKPAFYGNILLDGFYTGKNFLFPETFEYAKMRVNERSKHETIDKYRLFNNLLSSMPMTFNIFHPLMMIKEKYPEELDWMIRGLFPEFDIDHVDEIRIEFVPAPIRNYTNDKTAMDAAILFSDKEKRRYLIAFEVKYTDCLETNVAHDKVTKYKIALESGLFTETGLEQVNDYCPQIYRNFLLTEKYRMVHQLEDSYSIVLAPRGHPTTAKEISSLRNHLKRDYKYKIRSLSLEVMMDDLYERCPYEFLSWIGQFKERYLNFKTNELVR